MRGGDRVIRALLPLRTAQMHDALLDYKTRNGEQVCPRPPVARLQAARGAHPRAHGLHRGIELTPATLTESCEPPIDRSRAWPCGLAVRAAVWAGGSRRGFILRAPSAASRAALTWQHTRHGIARTEHTTMRSLY